MAHPSPTMNSFDLQMAKMVENEGRDIMGSVQM
jgi:hypothetical protein